MLREATNYTSKSAALRERPFSLFTCDASDYLLHSVSHLFLLDSHVSDLSSSRQSPQTWANPMIHFTFFSHNYAPTKNLRVHILEPMSTAKREHLQMAWLCPNKIVSSFWHFQCIPTSDITEGEKWHIPETQVGVTFQSLPPALCQ